LAAPSIDAVVKRRLSPNTLCQLVSPNRRVRATAQPPDWMLQEQERDYNQCLPQTPLEKLWVNQHYQILWVRRSQYQKLKDPTRCRVFDGGMVLVSYRKQYGDKLTNIKVPSNLFY
jgi:hypothetical protein